MLQHCLDVMHIEKNVCDNVLSTLLNDPKKFKDNLKAQKVLKEMGIRKELWPDDKGKIRPSVFSLSKLKKKTFLQTLKNVKMSDGYSSNISRCVDLKGGNILDSRVMIVIFLWNNYYLLPYVMFYQTM